MWCRPEGRPYGGSALPVLAQLNQQVGVGAGLVPTLRKDTHEGCPHPSWFGGNIQGGDDKPSPSCEGPGAHPKFSTPTRSLTGVHEIFPEESTLDK